MHKFSLFTYRKYSICPSDFSLSCLYCDHTSQISHSIFIMTMDTGHAYLIISPDPREFGPTQSRYNNVPCRPAQIPVINNIPGMTYFIKFGDQSDVDTRRGGYGTDNPSCEYQVMAELLQEWRADQCIFLSLLLFHSSPKSDLEWKS